MKEIFFKLFVIVAIFVLGGFSYFLYGEVKNLQTLYKNTATTVPDPVKVYEEKPDSLTTDFQAEIDYLKNYLNGVVATLSATKSTVYLPSSTQKDTQTTYVALGSTFKSMSTSWVDVPDSSAYIDVESDYGKDAYIEWEASLSVAYGNGQAFAHLWDDTNKIAVVGSEVSTTGNSTPQLSRSARLYLWRGRNLYKVQIKSLNGFEVTYASGRMKISY